jgi:hypothetical protein
MLIDYVGLQTAQAYPLFLGVVPPNCIYLEKRERRERGERERREGERREGEKREERKERMEEINDLITVQQNLTAYLLNDIVTTQRTHLTTGIVSQEIRRKKKDRENRDRENRDTKKIDK